MIENYKKIRNRRRLKKLRLMIFMSLKNTAVLTCIAGFITVSVPLFTAFEAHIINVTARIENDVPSIDPPGSYFCNDGSLTIKLYTSLAGASIIYTTDGTDPDCFLPEPDGNGTIYTGTPFSLTYSATVKARVCHDDNQSVIMSEDYIVTPEYCVEEKKCDALSIGYWQNHEGCPTPGSEWVDEIQGLSGEFSGVFSAISGEDICFYLAPSNCNSKEITEGKKLCQAKGKALADLSNVVSNRLDLNALIAGADDGYDAFDNLGLDSNSTVREALAVIESIIANPSATTEELENAAYVAERIYAFYEDENLNSPWCIYPEPGGSAVPDLLFSPSVSGAMTIEPPVEEEPTTDPPAEDPIPKKPKKEKSPAEDPVSEDPPVEDPPVEDPPVEDPPVEDPPVEDPPVEDPPVEDPPVEDPPVEDPPVEDPPVEDPPVEDPPVE